MLEEKLVSIIIPVYNVEKWVERCLLSVMNQTYHNLEIIVIDDGSTDESGQIISSLAEGDPRIRLAHQVNRGVAEARNVGIDMATGRYLTFVDGDDYLNRTYIEQFVCMAERTGAQMLICGVTFVNAKGKVLRKLVPDRYERFTHEEWCQRISGVCGHFYERRLWKESELRFVSGARGEDLPVSLYFSATCKKIDVVHEAGYAYVQHGTSARHRFRGLKTYKLPYKALEECLIKVWKEGIENSYVFFELFVLRILTTFLFDLSIGAEREKIDQLCDFIEKITTFYFPNYKNNPLIAIHSDVHFPLYQKIAVNLFVRILKSNKLRMVAYMLGCI